jgi:uncharacterized protein (DUF433 family)
MPRAPRIVSTPGICGGKPRIAGHRVRVLDIVAWHEILGLSAEEIAITYPALTLPEVEAALGYHIAHRAETRRHLAQEPQLVAELRQAHRSRLAARSRPSHRLRIERGQAHLPAELLADLGVTEGECVLIERIAGGVYRLEAQRRSLRRIHQDLEALAGEPSLADELLAERRAESPGDKEATGRATRTDDRAADAR